MIILNLIFMSIVLSIGIYYKIQNNKYNNTVTGANYESYQYRKLRDKYPNFYFFKIKNIKKKLIKGKRLNLAQKQIKLFFSFLLLFSIIH